MLGCGIDPACLCPRAVSMHEAWPRSPKRPIMCERIGRAAGSSSPDMSQRTLARPGAFPLIDPNRMKPPGNVEAESTAQLRGSAVPWGLFDELGRYIFAVQRNLGASLAWTTLRRKRAAFVEGGRGRRCCPYCLPDLDRMVCLTGVAWCIRSYED